MSDQSDDITKWPLAAYGRVIRGDETTSEDQVAEAYSPEMARRIAACVNVCAGINTDRLERFSNFAGILEFGVIAEQQRDELLAALNRIATEEIKNLGSARIVAREAIAKVEAAQTATKEAA